MRYILTLRIHVHDILLWRFYRTVKGSDYVCIWHLLTSMRTLHMISRTNNINWPSIRQVISVGWISYLFRQSHCRRTSSIIDFKYTLQMRNVILFQTRYSRPVGVHAGKVRWMSDHLNKTFILTLYLLRGRRGQKTKYRMSFQKVFFKNVKHIECQTYCHHIWSQCNKKHPCKYQHAIYYWFSTPWNRNTNILGKFSRGMKPYCHLSSVNINANVKLVTWPMD